MRAAVIFGLGTSPSNLDPFRAGSATEWMEGVPSSSDEADAVLIFGGDGTIHRHLAALVRLQLPVLVVPAGSGNDFARALSLRSVRDSLRAWRGFESGKIRPQAIDLGVIVPADAPERTHYFCCVAGCGLDSATAQRANRMPRWLRGHGGYVLALLPVLFKFPAFSMRLTDGGENEGIEKLTLLAAFANTQFYGDGMRIAPQADVADGMLDVCRISDLSTLKLLRLFPTVYLGRHVLVPGVEYWKAKRVRVKTEKPIEIYADGEFVCETPVEIGVAAGALRVISLQRL
jgi:diacylglycerol kinase (ATP)